MEHTFRYRGAEVQLRAEPPKKDSYGLLVFELESFIETDSGEIQLGSIDIGIFDDGITIEGIGMNYEEYPDIPKGIGKYMLCYAMESLLLGGLVTDNTEVSLDVEIGQRQYTGPIQTHPLVLYYERYGFELIENEDLNWMPHMKTTVRTIRTFCNKKEFKRKTEPELEPSPKRSRVSFGHRTVHAIDKEIRFLKTL